MMAWITKYLRVKKVTIAELVKADKGQKDEPIKFMTQCLIAARDKDMVRIHRLTTDQSEDVLNSQDVEGRTILMLGVRHGYTAFVSFLLDDSRILINMQDVKGQTALMKSASHGHFVCMVCLLTRPDIDTNLKDEKGRTALLLAAQKGHLECVQRLLDFSKDIKNSNDWEKERKLAFILAVMNGHTDCVRYLLEAKTTQSVDESNTELHSAIVLTIRQSHLDCLDYLLRIRPRYTGIMAYIMEDILRIDLSNDTHSFIWQERLAVLDVQTSYKSEQAHNLYRQLYKDHMTVKPLPQCTAVMLCIPSECICCLCKIGETNRQIFKHCIDVLDTVIALAVANSHFDCVKRLLENSLSPSFKLKAMALVIAVSKGNVECLKYLLEFPTTDEDGVQTTGINNVLLLASVSGYVECVKCLLGTGQVNVNHHNGDRHTALILSAKHGHAECVKCLIDTGLIDVNYADRYGNTPLIISAGEGHVKCVQYLLGTVQVDVNHHNWYGNTALLLSAQKGHVKCVKSLLDIVQVDVNHHDDDGNTALMLSALKDHVQCVKCLLDSKQCDVNHQNLKGCNAFILAAFYGRLKCVECLHDTGKVDISPANEYGITAIKEAVVKEKSRHLMLLLEHMSYNDVMYNRIKGIFLENSKRLKQLLYIPHFLNARLFHWSWYPEFPSMRQRFLTRELVISGYAPRQFEWKGKPSSPLHHAFMINDDGLVRYVIANLYLTSFDVKNFQTDKNLQTHVNLNGSESLKRLHRQIYSSPWRLKALSLLKISTLLKNECRDDDMSEELKEWLIEDFQLRLGFENPIRWLCLHQWVCIDIDYILCGRGPIWLDSGNSFQAKCCNNICKRLRLSHRCK